MKKKILFVHPALVMGGAETVLISYLNILSKYSEKYEVDVAFIENRQNFNFDKIPNNINIHFILSDVESEFLIYLDNRRSEDQTINRNYYQSWFDGIKERSNFRLLELINKYNYDVIIDFSSVVSSFEYFINKFDLAKRIVCLKWVHSSSVINNFINDPCYYSYILNKYSALITICPDMEQSCKDAFNQLGIRGETIYSIFNPINLEAIHNNECLETEIESDIQKLQESFILQVARLEERQKNHLELIEIYARLKQLGIKEKLYIIGDGSSKQQLQDKINELELTEECLLLGERKNPFIFMKYAKLFLHTANYEGLPTVFIESMACGTPVIAYNCPTGPKDILENGKYGILIPMGDQDLFVEKAHELLTDESKLNHYKRLLPESVQRFSFDVIGQQFLDLLENEFKKKK